MFQQQQRAVECRVLFAVKINTLSRHITATTLGAQKNAFCLNGFRSFFSHTFVLSH